MKMILVLLLAMLCPLAGYSANYINSGNIHIKLPNHWSSSGSIGSGTNFVYTEESIYTNSHANQVYIFTNEATSFSEDYVSSTLGVASVGPEDFESTSSSYGSITNGIVQLRSDGYINNLLSHIQTNRWYSDYYSASNSIPSYINNIVSYPLIKTNGLIIKMYISDFTITDELNEELGWSAKPGKQTDLIVLDQNEIYFMEAFATYDSEDAAYTTNIFRYIYTDNPISRYGSYFEREPGYIQLSEYRKLFIPEGMTLEFKGYQDIGNSIDVEIRLNDSWVTYDRYLVHDDISFSPLNGPIQMRWKRVTDYRNPPPYVLFELKYAKSHYLQTISSLVEQLSNTVSQTTTSTMTVTNTVHKTITNTVDFTLSEMADLRYGAKNISVHSDSYGNNMAYFDFAIDSSRNLDNQWQKIGEITVPINVGTNDIGFFRIRGEDQISTNEPASFFEDYTETIMDPFPDGGAFSEIDATDI